MNEKYVDSITLLLSDRKTELQFDLYPSGNRIESIEYKPADQINEIQIITNCYPEQPLIPYPENYYSPGILDLLLAQITSIENYYHCAVPEYATLIRALLFELHRLLNHFHYFSTIFDSIQFPKAFEISAKNAGLIHSLFNEISANRSLEKLFVIGGISTDIPDGFIEKLFRTLGAIQGTLKYIERQFTHRTLFSDLFINIGIINSEKAAALALSGPNRIASQEITEYVPETMFALPDFFESEPIHIDFSKGTTGDSWHRAWIRYLEINHSINQLFKLSDTIVKSDVVLLDQPPIRERSLDFHTCAIGSEGQIQSVISRKSHHFYFTGKHQYSIVNIIRNLNSFLKNERLSSAKVTLASLNVNPIRYHLKQ